MWCFIGYISFKKTAQIQYHMLNLKYLTNGVPPCIECLGQLTYIRKHIKHSCKRKKMLRYPCLDGSTFF